MKYGVLKSDGSWLGINGDSNFASEAITFTSREGALHASLRYVGSQVIPMRCAGRYEATPLREHESFMDHICGANS